MVGVESRVKCGDMVGVGSRVHGGDVGGDRSGVNCRGMVGA